MPSSLVSFERTSPAVTKTGDTVTIDWTVEDVPAFYVAFYFYDSLGNRHQATYNDEPAYSGTSTFVVIENVGAAGPLTLKNVLVKAGKTQVDYHPNGIFYKSPAGLHNPKTTTFDFAQPNMNFGNQVSPTFVEFLDYDGAKGDVYVVPATVGVDYLGGGKVVAAGTYPGTGTVTVTAKAKTDYVLAAGAAASWTATSKATPFVQEKRGDFNGDGKADVIARDGSGTLWLYPGNGTGGWLPAQRIGSGWNVMTAIG